MVKVALVSLLATALFACASPPDPFTYTYAGNERYKITGTYQIKKNTLNIHKCDVRAGEVLCTQASIKLNDEEKARLLERFNE